MSGADRQQGSRRTVRRLWITAAAMFTFGFALVPLYNVFCEVTGLNGKTGNVNAEVLDGKVDESRLVTVEFVASVNEDMPWEFRPAVTRMRVHPGAVSDASFYARNQTGKVMIGQAIPSVTPGEAARHFSKTECFCFTQQRFEAGEGRDMPVRFVVDRNLPKDIKTLTLSYTFFDITKQAMASVQ